MNYKGGGYDYVFKVVIVGDSAVGKTSLLDRFIEDRFINNSLTIVPDLKSKIIELDRKHIEYCVWDTAGQERFRGLTHSYFRRADGVFLMYDISNCKSFENLDKWLNDVNGYAAEDVVKILVGNKRDLPPSVNTHEAQEYAKKSGMLFIETSAKYSANIENAFQLMVMEIYQKKLQDGCKPLAKTIVLPEKETDKKKDSCCWC